MVLSDELIKLGMTAAKDKASQSKQMEKMVKKVKEHPFPDEKLKKVVVFTCQRLNKMGFVFYDASKIFERLKEDEQ